MLNIKFARHGTDAKRFHSAPAFTASVLVDASALPAPCTTLLPAEQIKLTRGYGQEFINPQK